MNTLPISTIASIACILEATARKPGNVNRFRDFDDLNYVDLIVSAAAMAPVLDNVQERGVGQSILEAVKRTRQVVATNANLGIILLLTPLAAVPREIELKEGIQSVLDSLTVEDAKAAYEAIRLAKPSGLGHVAEQDIEIEPTLTLRQVMALAAERDLVAKQYANGFEEVLQFGLPVLNYGLSRDWPFEKAVIYCHLMFMAHFPDSLIARKLGPEIAQEASQRAGNVLKQGPPETEKGIAAMEEFDAWLRADGNKRNPGTTADLVTACLFAALREGKMQLVSGE